VEAVGCDINFPPSSNLAIADVFRAVLRTCAAGPGIGNPLKYGVSKTQMRTYYRRYNIMIIPGVLAAPGIVRPLVIRPPYPSIVVPLIKTPPATAGFLLSRCSSQMSLPQGRA
jgi:hypothetical protein